MQVERKKHILVTSVAGKGRRGKEIFLGHYFG